MRLPRKDNDLNDAIEALDQKFLAAKAAAKTDIAALPLAWDSLDSNEIEFVDQEIERCISDRKYFIQNYYVIRDERGQLQALHNWWSHQDIIYEVVQEEWLVKGCCRLIILKPRQAGSTTWNAALLFHATIFTPNAYSLAMAQNQEVSLEIFTRMMDAFHQMPWWLRPEMSSKQQGLHVVFQRGDEQRRMTDPGLGSTLMVSNAQKSSGVAIGRTVKNLMASEVSRWPDSSVWTADIEPSLNAPDMLGIMESTAYGRKGLYYNMWHAAMNGKSDWRALFIPVYKVTKYFLPLKPNEVVTLTAEEKALRKSTKEKENFVIPLGFFKWRRMKVKECIAANGNDDEHAESYPVTPGEAFLSSGFCAFPKKELNRQEREHCRPPALIGEIEYNGAEQQPILHLHPPDESEISDKPERVNRFWVWDAPEEGAEYYIGADVGGTGEDNDFSDCPVYKVGYGTEPDVQVAEWHGHINGSHFADVLAAIGYWYNTAEIAVEYMKSGITTGDDLQWRLDYPAIYRWRRMDKVGSTLTMTTHWITNERTREDAINRTVERMLDRRIIIRNVHLIEEMRDFGREDDGGKAQGLDNHDDMVMATLICIGALNQTGKRNDREEAMGMGTSVNSSAAAAVMPRAPVLYGLFDLYGRQVNCDVPIQSMAQAKQIMAECSQRNNLDLSKHWTIKPITVMKCNTPWSASWDSQGAEHELRERMGVDPRNQSPEIVSLYRRLLNQQRGGESVMDEESD